MTVWIHLLVTVIYRRCVEQHEIFELSVIIERGQKELFSHVDKNYNPLVDTGFIVLNLNAAMGFIEKLKHDLSSVWWC